MLFKLSYRNAKRQAKDYIIYFTTIVLTIALIFSFNSLVFSKDVIELSNLMKNFQSAIYIVTIFVVFVMGFLINYIMKFMIEKRSKEFAMYSILGMEKKQVSKMYVLENLLIGIFALILGIILGTILYQIFIVIIMNLFEQPYKINIFFDIRAMLLTVGYFMLIFALVLWKTNRKIKKTKDYDLLYAEKKNEEKKLDKKRSNIIVFVVSIVLLIVGIILLLAGIKQDGNVNMKYNCLAIVILIIGIYLFYISLSAIICRLILENKKRKYQDYNIFIYRNLASKLNSTSVTMGTIAVLLTITLVGMTTGILIKRMLEKEIEVQYPFEVEIQMKKEEDSSKFKEIISKHQNFKELYEYEIYPLKEKTKVKEILQNTPYESGSNYYSDIVISLSDYNYLRKMLNLSKVEMNENQYILQIVSFAEKYFQKEELKNLKIGNKTYELKEINMENLSQWYFNGYVYFIVLPDEEVNQLIIDKEERYKKRLVATFDGTIKNTLYNELQEVNETEITEEETIRGTINVEQKKSYVSTRGFRITENKSSYTIFSFIIFYLALIFITTSATILAIQQLSDAEKYKYRYQLLKSLGTEKSKIDELIWYALLLYFILPIILPIILGMLIMIPMSKLFIEVIVLTEVLFNFITISAIFFLVYILYLIATYVEFRKICNK